MTVPVDLSVSLPASLVRLVEVEGGAGVTQQQAQPLLLPQLLVDKKINYSSAARSLQTFKSAQI